MNFLEKVCIFFSILPLARSSYHQEFFNPDHLFPRPPVIGFSEIDEEVYMQCTRWRVALEADDVIRPWKTIPKECGDYVEEYMRGRDYEVDLQRVSEDAEIYARSLNLSKDGKDAWVFDVDETLLSNLPYYSQHGYGLQIYDSTKFDRWVETGMAPAIESSLKLYEGVLNLGLKIILLTGRSERHRSITVENLSKAGFGVWEKLILRSVEDHEKTAIKYKSDKRNELVEEGYRLLGNSGDQWSDLLGPCMSNRSFKLPNPILYMSSILPASAKICSLVPSLTV
ncbi:hypothetical protein ACS0TY_001243 [Phlomoides rotata]